MSICNGILQVEDNNSVETFIKYLTRRTRPQSRSWGIKTLADPAGSRRQGRSLPPGHPDRDQIGGGRGGGWGVIKMSARMGQVIDQE